MNGTLHAISGLLVASICFHPNVLQGQIQAPEPGRRVPVTVIYRVVHYRDGKPVDSNYLIWAYRANGSNAHRMLSESQYEVVDYEKGIGALVDPKIRAITSQNLPPNARRPVARSCREAFPEPMYECLGPVEEKMLGFNLEKVVWRGLHGQVTERLVAPELQYIPLRRVDRRSDGTPTMELTAVEVRTGEPDPSLFFIPEDYAKLPRHEHYKQAMEARGRELSERTYEMLKRGDEMRKKLCQEGKLPPETCQ